MVLICCVNGCRSEAFLGCGMSFHMFPKNEEVKKKWMDVVPGKVTKHSAVCGLHFKPDDFANILYAQKKRLKINAVPSIFPRYVTETDMDNVCEIEYLDEDEELVQQYVQAVENAPEEAETTPLVVLENVRSLATEDLEDKITPLLIERKPDLKRKAKEEEVDSDYNPHEDMLLLRKKKKFTRRSLPLNPPKPVSYEITKSLTQSQQKPVTSDARRSATPQTPVTRIFEPAIPITEVKKFPKRPKVVKKPTTVESSSLEDISERKNYDIRIPDYEDPLCLSVKAIVKNEIDDMQVKNWNRLCLEYFNNCDKVLAPPRGRAVGSTRSVALKNVQNHKLGGRIETTLWVKLAVVSDTGEKKFEVFKHVLPSYQERKVLPTYNLKKDTQKKYHHTFEVILQKEEHHDGEALVVYKPKDAISAVYKCIEKKSQSKNENEEDNQKNRITMKEVTSCRVCAPCYQMSWRGVRKRKETNVTCKICSRTSVSVYNLLAHLNKHHTPEEVRKHKDEISATLAEIVEYHYKCRVCQEHLPSIKQLRTHVAKHQGTEVFKCDIGNHMTS